MYYFKVNGVNVLNLNIQATPFEPSIEEKIQLQITTKGGIDIFIVNYDGDKYPVKKSSALKKKIIDALLNKNWDLFQNNGDFLEGIANEDGELVAPELLFVSPKIEKIKKQSFSYLNKILLENNLPQIFDEDILKKQKLSEYLHIYYRVNNSIYHICINEYDNSLVTYEVFGKLN